MIDCILCGEQFENLVCWINHLDLKHPEVAEAIKQKWREEGLIK